MQASSRFLLLVTAASLVGSACIRPRTGAVREAPPERWPRFADEDVRPGSPCSPDSLSRQVAHVRDLLVVQFRPTASAGERQAVAEAVPGQLVGADSRFGLYFFRLTTDSTGQTTCRALNQLRTLPSVAAVMPYLLMRLGPERASDGDRQDTTAAEQPPNYGMKLQGGPAGVLVSGLGVGRLAAYAGR